MASISRREQTPGGDFDDIGRGEPVPHCLVGGALVRARLAPEMRSLDALLSNDDQANVTYVLPNNDPGLHRETAACVDSR